MKLALLLLILALPLAANAGEPTRRLQEELRKRNLYFGDVDGKASPEFAGALRTYQQRKGFQPTGEPDQETLASLKLAPPPATSPDLPGEPVYRSDQAREISEQDRVALEAAFVDVPVEEPEPVASAPEEDVAEKAREFIASYLAQAERNELEKELSFYGYPLNYFDHGKVERGYVEKDVRRYYKRWPERDYTLLAPPAVGAVQANDRLAVTFKMKFSVKNEARTARGQTEYVFTLDTSSPDWKVVGLKERRLR